ncbi:MAG TPA: hypothetical protein VK154_09135 [Chitinophagales bacterium]|nr:hypothetical protein [Chitinophagales bacterium]
MSTFAEILNEATQVLQMAETFNTRYLEPARIQQNAPCVVIPAPQTTQGEQKMPVAKPNGITR